MSTARPHSRAADDSADPRSVVARITRLLAALASADDEGLSGAEIARKASLPPATAHRLLVRLEQEGVTVRRAASRSWALGGVVLGWGEAANRQHVGRSRFHEVLRAIGQSTKETVVLTVREGWHGTHVDLVESPTRLRIVEHVGLRLPLTVGASRRAILAFMPQGERHRVLSRYVPSGADREWIQRDLELTRQLGYSVSAGEVTAYSIGIAVPILTNDTAEASIMVGGPAPRVRVPALRQALEVMEQLIRPRELLPSLATEKVEDALSLAEERAQRLKFDS